MNLDKTHSPTQKWTTPLCSILVLNQMAFRFYAYNWFKLNSHPLRDGHCAQSIQEALYPLVRTFCWVLEILVTAISFTCKTISIASDCSFMGLTFALPCLNGHCRGAQDPLFWSKKPHKSAGQYTLCQGPLLAWLADKHLHWSSKRQLT